MKNIKKPLYRCTCPDCKTIFDVEYEEFKNKDGFHYNSHYLAINCPTCGKEIAFFNEEAVKTIYPRKAKENKNESK